MKELSEKSYWDGVIKNKSVNFKSFAKLPLMRHIALGFYNWDFFRICKKYMKREYKTVFEVGCAPGNYLIQFHTIFGLSPCGIEYADNGMVSIRANFLENGIDGDIDHGDFFDPEYIKKNEAKFDVVYSMGFIEHFDNPQEAIDNHFHLTKPGGLVIITLPNLYYLNQYFVEKEILDIHNLTIMRTDIISKYFAGKKVLENRYFGGFWNAGSFIFSNFFLEKIRLGIFIFQRLIFDPICILLSVLHIDLSNRYTSPSMIIICRKD